MIINMDCVAGMRLCLADNSVDAIVCDPPYELGFMGKAWDASGIANSVEMWREALRVLKPGGHLLAFSGSRTYHRMACAIEDAGFEVRDQIMWVYGSGFPKSLDVSKAIDKTGGESVAWFGPWFRAWREENSITQKQVAALFPSKSGGLTGCVANWELGLNMPTVEQFNLIRDTFALPFDSIESVRREIVGKSRWSNSVAHFVPGENHAARVTLDITAPATEAARQWEGWGTALKPAHEPICVARKPLAGTVAANVLAHGVGALNIDGCRVLDVTETGGAKPAYEANHANAVFGAGMGGGAWENTAGRWPANVITDGSDAVLAEFSGMGRRQNTGRRAEDCPSKFFYVAKPSQAERNLGCEGLPPSRSAPTPALRDGSRETESRQNTHPTVKPLALMQYLVRLVTPPGGLVLDPFTGSGSTWAAAKREGFQFVGFELDPHYCEIAKRRAEAA